MSGVRTAGEITVLLRRWRDGETEALRDLTSIVYGELRGIAEGYLRRERPGHTLQATGLVNELYVRLAGHRGVDLEDRRHFYTFSAMLMRRILIDHARRTKTAMGPAGGAARVPLHPDMAWVDAAGEDMFALEQALEELAAADERKVRVIELRYLLGCTNEETAKLLDVTRSTVDRDLQFSKAWLYRRLHPDSA